MRFLLAVVLLLAATAITSCGPMPSVTVEPTETPIPLEVTHAAPALTPPGGSGPAMTTELSATRRPLVTPARLPALTPSTGGTMTPAPAPSQEPAPEGPQLRMVIIRARSSLEVKQLRQMHLDIVRVMPDPKRPPGEESLSGGFIVEAVVTPGMLAKLEAMGFEITEAPPQK